MTFTLCSHYPAGIMPAVGVLAVGDCWDDDGAAMVTDAPEMDDDPYENCPSALLDELAQGGVSRWDFAAFTPTGGAGAAQRAAVHTMSVAFPDEGLTTLSKVAAFIEERGQEIFAALRQGHDPFLLIDAGDTVKILFDGGVASAGRVAVLRRGGAGLWKTMYKALDLSTAKIVATTIIACSTTNESSIAAERMGYRAVEGIPQFVQCKGILSDAEKVLFMSSYCDRGTVKQWLKSNPSYGAKLFVATEWAGALTALNARGFYHCDDTLDNIMLKGDENSPYGFIVKVIDYGCMRKMEGDVLPNLTLPMSHQPPEWHAYRQAKYALEDLEGAYCEDASEAPATAFADSTVDKEQLQAMVKRLRAALGPPTEVYMLGVSLYNLFYNKMTVQQELVQQRLEERIPIDRLFKQRIAALHSAPLKATSSAGDSLGLLLDRMLQLDPDGRPAMAEVHHSLRLIQQGRVGC